MTPTELKQAREALGMTQDALATALGLSRSAIARMEAGQSRIVKAIELAIEHLKGRAGLSSAVEGQSPDLGCWPRPKRKRAAQI